MEKVNGKNESMNFPKTKNFMKFIVSKAFVVRMLILCTLLYTVLISAWLTDDALISFRHIWNFANGDGITFNFGERVQGFSHPLWFLILSIATYITQDLLLTSIVISILFSILSILILLSIEFRNFMNLYFITPVLLLTFSFAYCDFTSSGLENPLSYLLVGLLLWFLSSSEYEKYRKLIFVIFSLLILTRLDFLLLILPLAIFLIFKDIFNTKLVFFNLFRDLYPSALIIFVWIVFSIIYFGFPLPNTYYAKLSAGFPLEGYIIRGLYYILELIYDPASFIIIVSALLISLYSRNKILIALTIGQLLYMLYIIYIGGDFMRGRFFSVLVYLSVGQLVIALSCVSISIWLQRYGLLIIIFAIFIGSVADFRFPFMSTVNYEGRQRLDADSKLGVGMQDERGYFYKHFGLFSPTRDWLEIKDQLNKRPTAYQVYCGQLGALSLFQRSNILDKSVNGEHIIDFCALTDPLLSKIPAIEDKRWRIGHNIRKIPSEYGEFLIGNISELPDKNIRKFANDIKLVTMGELFTLNRFKAIWRLNSNFYSNLKMEKYSNPSIWVPLTTKIKKVYIENWDVEIEELSKPNIKFKSSTPLVSTGVTFKVNPAYVYEILVNDELIATNKTANDNQELHLPFLRKMSVKSITIRAIGINGIGDKKRWWIYTFKDRIKFVSLWSTK